MEKPSCRSVGLALGMVLAFATPAFAQFQISEILADNETGLMDEDGSVQDWIEIQNHSATKQSLAGWALTDDPQHARKWIFPDVSIAPGGYLVVFASGEDRRTPGKPLHATFKLKAGGDYLALLNPQGEPADAFHPKFPKQRADLSYGRPRGESETAARDFLAYPTPGQTNTERFVGKLSGIELSVPHGVFAAPFTLNVSAPEPDVTVHYTTDGSTPGEQSEKLNGSLAINGTTVLRARGFKPGHTPTPVVTASYLFPRDRIDDSADGLPPEGYPWEWGAGKANYGLDENITSNPELREKFVEALHALPSYSLVAEVDDLFSDERGIYAHAGWHGRRAERRISLELLPLAGKEKGFQIEAGLRMRGGSSREPRYQKHGFRLFFRSQYGQAKLDYDLFHGEGATEFKHFDLRCSQQYSWHHGFSPNALYVRDEFGRDTQLAMGQPGARGNFAHLYINGHYWGVFNTCERPEADFGESYLGGDADDFDVMKMRGGYSEDDGDRQRGLVPTDGNSDNWNKLHQLTSADLSDVANYTRVLGLNPDGTPDPRGQRLVDPVNLIDYMLVIFYVGHLDAPITWFGQNRWPNNWYGLMNRERNEGFRFIVWDAEQALLRIGDDRLGPFPAGEHIRASNPQWTYQRLLDNEEFRMLLADRVAKHLFRDGALTPAAATARFDKRINELRPGLFAEAARWGNPKKTFEWALNESSPNEKPSSRENGVVKYDNWLKETERFKAEYLTQRTDIVINQLKIRGLYPDLPEIEANWRDDQTLELAAAGSAIVFTTDGTDPRLFGGRRSDAARRYDAPLRVSAGTQLRCRIFDHGEWGPLRELSRPVGRSATN